MPDKSERLYERGILSEDGEKVVHKYLLYDDQGAKTVKLQTFRMGIERLIKSIKFSQFEAQSQ